MLKAVSSCAWRRVEPSSSAQPSSRSRQSYGRQSGLKRSWEEDCGSWLRFLLFAGCRMEQGEAGRFCVVVRAERGLCQPLAGTRGCKTTQPAEIQVICNCTAYTQRDGEMSALPQQPAEAAIKPVLITRDGRGNVHLIERKKAAVPWGASGAIDRSR